jgi:uncharacterized protein YbjT (DUF2867 family)
MYIVIGATGQVGGVVANTLLNRGEDVRVVVRQASKGAPFSQRGADVFVADILDVPALATAFEGASGAFLVNPPAYASADMFVEAERVAEAFVAAAREASLPKLVYLSSVGADRPDRQGNIATTRIIEENLSTLSSPIAFVRAAWFIENWAGALAPAVEKSVVPSFLTPLDRSIPMVATADIGRVVSDILLENWTGRRIVELEGPQDYSPRDVAAAISDILGNPVKAVAVPRQDWAAFFRSKGNSAHSADAWVEMIDAFNDGWMTFEGGHERRVGTVGLIEALSAKAVNPTVLSR